MAPFYRANWSERPAAAVWRHLEFERWWTNAAGLDAKDGRFSVRGCLGEYEVSASTGSRSITVPVRPEQAGRALPLPLR